MGGWERWEGFWGWGGDKVDNFCPDNLEPFQAIIASTCTKTSLVQAAAGTTDRQAQVVRRGDMC